MVKEKIYTKARKYICEVRQITIKAKLEQLLNSKDSIIDNGE